MPLSTLNIFCFGSVIIFQTIFIHVNKFLWFKWIGEKYFLKLWVSIFTMVNITGYNSYKQKVFGLNNLYEFRASETKKFENCKSGIIPQAFLFCPALAFVKPVYRVVSSQNSSSAIWQVRLHCIPSGGADVRWSLVWSCLVLSRGWPGDRQMAEVLFTVEWISCQWIDALRLSCSL